MAAVQRLRTRRAEARYAVRRHGPPRPAHGVWRNRARYRPDPGSGGGGGRSSEPAPTVLLVDDEVAIRTICRVNLEGEGMTVFEATDGRDALEQIRRQQPSLVLLDVMMPDVDGWRVAEQLADDPDTSAIPVVFLSARAAHEDRVRAQELGAVGYIVKPFDPLGLAGFVREVLARIRRGEREELNRELLEEG